jgi:transcriptional regulator with XRE-family HTH domain
MITTLMEQLNNDDQLRRQFGARIKELRKERKLTQKEAAAYLGVQGTHLNKYESGIHAPPLEKIILLAKLFGVSLDFMILGQKPEGRPIQNTHLLERFQLMEEFERDDQETVVKVIDAMLAKTRIEKAIKPMPL